MESPSSAGVPARRSASPLARALRLERESSEPDRPDRPDQLDQPDRPDSVVGMEALEQGFSNQHATSAADVRDASGMAGIAGVPELSAGQPLAISEAVHFAHLHHPRPIRPLPVAAVAALEEDAEAYGALLQQQERLRVPMRETREKNRAANALVDESRNTIMRAPGNAKPVLPPGLLAKNWKQGGAYSRLALNDTGVGEALRNVSTAFHGAGMEDDVVAEVEKATTTRLKVQASSVTTDVAERYTALTEAVLVAEERARKTLERRSGFLTADSRAKLASLIAELVALHGQVQERCMLIRSKDAMDVAAHAIEGKKLGSRAQEYLKSKFAGAVDGVRAIPGGCTSLADVKVAFPEGGQYRSLCNFVKFLETVQKHRPDVAQAAGAPSFCATVRTGYIWQAANGPFVESLRAKAGETDAAYPQAARRIDDALDHRIRELEAYLQSLPPVEALSEADRAAREADMRSLLGTARAQAAADRKALDKGRLVQDLPKVKEVLDALQNQVRAFEADGSRVLRVVQQALDDGQAAPPAQA